MLGDSKVSRDSVELRKNLADKLAAHERRAAHRRSWENPFSEIGHQDSEDAVYEDVLCNLGPRRGLAPAGQ